VHRAALARRPVQSIDVKQALGLEGVPEDCEASEEKAQLWGWLPLEMQVSLVVPSKLRLHNDDLEAYCIRGPLHGYQQLFGIMLRAKLEFTTGSPR
jgi:hypothetical protein